MNELGELEPMKEQEGLVEEKGDVDRESTVAKSLSDAIISHDAMDTEDHFSQHPDLCVLKIFKKLTRRDIYNVTRVSKRFLPLYHDQSLDRRKWEGGELTLLQTERGYGFVLTIACEDYLPTSPQFNGHASYRYEIVKSEDGGFIEKKIYKDQRINEDSTRNDPHDFPVPDDFFDALAIVLQHHEVTQVGIDRLPSDIFPELAKLLIGHKIKSVKYTYLMSGPIIRDEANLMSIRKSFAEIYKDVQSADLRFMRKIYSLINEEFFHVLNASEQRDRDLFFSCDIDQAWPHYFYPNESILPSLVNFKNFEMYSMILNVNMIASLIMARMDAMTGESSIGTWRIAVDQMITPEIILQTIRTSEYEHRTQDTNTGIWQFLKSKASGMETKFYPVQYGYDGDKSLDVVFIHFSNWQPTWQNFGRHIHRFN